MTSSYLAPRCPKCKVCRTPSGVPYGLTTSRSTTTIVISLKPINDNDNDDTNPNTMTMTVTMKTLLNLRCTCTSPRKDTVPALRSMSRYSSAPRGCTTNWAARWTMGSEPGYREIKVARKRGWGRKVWWTFGRGWIGVRRAFLGDLRRRGRGRGRGRDRVDQRVSPHPPVQDLPLLLRQHLHRVTRSFPTETNHPLYTQHSQTLNKRPPAGSQT